MPLLRHLRASYNPWFMIPFLLWMLLGAGIFVLYSRDVIFRFANLNGSPLLDCLMQVATGIGDGLGSAIILFSMMIFFKSCRNWWYVLAAAFCTIAPALLIQVIKNIVQAPRPLEYYKTDSSWIHIREQWPHLYHNSFPSGHSGSVFSMCAFLSMILPKGWMRLGLGLFVLALVVAYSRMYLAAHFYADIFVGSILGTVGCVFCMALMRRWSKRSFRIVRTSVNRKKPPLI